MLSSPGLPQALLGCSEFPGDVLALLGCSECPGLQDGLMRTVGVGREDPQPIMLFRFPPWGGRPSRFRVRARGINFLFFFIFRCYTIPSPEKKKWSPANRVRAQTPTNTSPHAPLTYLPLSKAGKNERGRRTAWTTRRRRQLKARVHSPLFLDHRRGRRLSAGASPCRRIPRGGAVPSQACCMCGASSTRVAARVFSVATDIMFHHRFSHANAADFVSLGATSWPFAAAGSRIK